MTPPLADLAFDGPIATLTLNRPQARNALSIDLIADLHASADELAARPDAVVAIVTGSGRAFCAGMDLRAVTSHEGLAAGLPLRLLSQLADLTLKLRALPQVTIARVNGAAIGGGCGLACVCDVAVSHEDATLGFPEVDLGVCPAVVAPWLVRKIGPGRARRVLLCGGVMTGRQAADLGLVDRVCPTAAELDALTGETAHRLAAGGPAALRATKALLNELDGSTDGGLLRRGAELSARVLASPEAQAMLRAKFGARDGDRPPPTVS